MDLRSVASPFNLDNESWPIRTLAYDNPPGNFISEVDLVIVQGGGLSVPGSTLVEHATRPYLAVF